MVLSSAIKTLSTLTLALSSLLVFTGIGGVFFTDAVYSKNGAAYMAQGFGTDIGNLVVIVPLLLISAILMRQGSKRSLIVWFGTMLYVLYLSIYACFTIHFNYFFLAYTAELGITIYSLFIAIAALSHEDIKGWFTQDTKTTPVIIYLVFIGSFFILFWLTDIIPSSIAGTLPKSAADLGLITAAFHALDLGVFFPGFLISACLLFKKHSFGYLLAPAFLVFAVIMTLCLVFLVVVSALRGIVFQVSDIFLFGSVTLLSSVILIGFMRYCKTND